MTEPTHLTKKQQQEARALVAAQKRVERLQQELEIAQAKQDEQLAKQSKGYRDKIKRIELTIESKHKTINTSAQRIAAAKATHDKYVAEQAVEIEELEAQLTELWQVVADIEGDNPTTESN